MNVDEMIAELSAGRDARARVPELEKRIADITSWKERTEQHNQELELNIIGYKQSIDSLQVKVVELAKARDDAQFAQAEAEDNLKSFRKLIESYIEVIAKGMQGIIAADDALNPPNPVQVDVPEVVAPQANPPSPADPKTPGPSELGPTAPSTTAVSYEPAPSTSVISEKDVSSSGEIHSNPDQREPLPTAATSTEAPLPSAPLPNASDYELDPRSRGMD